MHMPTWVTWSYMLHVRVGILLTSEKKHVHDRIFSLRVEALANKTSLTRHFFIEVPSRAKKVSGQLYLR